MKSVLLAAVAVVASCQAAHAPTRSAPGVSDAPKIFRFHIGDLTAFALDDGDIEIPNDAKVLGAGKTADEVAIVLASAGLSTKTLSLAIQSLLVEDDGRVLLFDTGAADASFARAGHLPAALARAGVSPASVTDIFISHAHPDHIGGLVTRDHALAFPNAVIHMSAPEWAAVQRDASASMVAAAIAAKVAPFEPGARLVPHVTAVETAGHTPGHSSYEIESSGEKLLYLGDVAHHYVVSLRRPEWDNGFDADRAAGRATRERVLTSLARSGERVFAVHFPFPGLGRIRTIDDGYAWAAEP